MKKKRLFKNLAIKNYEKTFLKNIKKFVKTVVKNFLNVFKKRFFAFFIAKFFKFATSINYKTLSASRVFTDKTECTFSHNLLRFHAIPKNVLHSVRVRRYTFCWRVESDPLVNVF